MARKAYTQFIMAEAPDNINPDPAWAELYQCWPSRESFSGGMLAKTTTSRSAPVAADKCSGSLQEKWVATTRSSTEEAAVVLPVITEYESER